MEAAAEASAEVSPEDMGGTAVRADGSANGRRCGPAGSSARSHR